MKRRKLTESPMYWVDVFGMIKRRAKEESARSLLLRLVIFYLRYNS